MNTGTLVAGFGAANFAAAARYLRAPAAASDIWFHRVEILLVTTGLIATLAARNWVAAGFCVATLVLLARDWWNRKGRKSAKALGEKSRAALAAIVDRAREAGSPLPSPEGARA